MKDNGKIIWLMDRGGFGTLMETSTTVTGRKTRLMVMEFTRMSTVQSTKATGRTTCKMVRAKRLG